MNAPVEMAHAVLWIDHRHATLLRIDAGSALSRQLRAHHHPTAQHGSDVRSEHEFFAEVCASLQGIGSVLVTGGKTALIDFRHYVDKHRPRTAEQLAAYEVVDHPSERQLAALGRAYFQLEQPRAGVE